VRVLRVNGVVQRVNRADDVVNGAGCLGNGDGLRFGVQFHFFHIAGYHFQRAGGFGDNPFKLFAVVDHFQQMFVEFINRLFKAVPDFYQRPLHTADFIITEFADIAAKVHLGY